MDSKDRRRQARLQGLHMTRRPNARVTADSETAVEQPKFQDEVDKAYSSSQTFDLEDGNHDTANNITFPETQMVNQSAARNYNSKPSRGRKSTQRYNSIYSRSSDYQPSKIRDRNLSSDGSNTSSGNVDETTKRLNGLKVNDGGNDHILREEKVSSDPVNKQILRKKDSTSDGTKSYHPSNVRQSSNRNFQGYTHNKEQRYSPKSRSNFGRGRSNRGTRKGPNVDRIAYALDEGTFKKSFVVNSFSNKRKIQAQSEQYNISNYELNVQLETGSSNDKATNSSYKKVVRSSSNFVYEETNQRENLIQKPKGPITLNIIGWHKLIQCNPEDKESYLYFEPDFLGEEEKGNYFQHLKDSIKWQEKEIIIRGEKYMQPRLVAWYGPLPYSYSNTVLDPNTEFPPVIMDIKQRIENVLKKEQRNVTFNSVLLNLYRNGKDSVAWHSDDELSMGVHPTIASVSLGETRRFEIKLKQGQKENGASPEASEEFVIHLTSGSLLVMDGAMQEYWLHRVPKEFHDRNCRINLTFRIVYPMKEKKQRS